MDVAYPLERAGRVLADRTAVAPGADRHATLFLASDDAKYVTAAELVVDGGIAAKYS